MNLNYLYITDGAALTTDSPAALRAVSQFRSFKIRRATFLIDIKFVDPRILKLLNCERARRAANQYKAVNDRYANRVKGLKRLKH